MRLPASLLARQTPAVRALLAKAQNRGALVTTEVTRDGDVIVIVLRGMKMPSLSNLTGWKAVNRAKQAQSKVLRPLLAGLARPPLPWDVEITRIAPKLLDVATNCDASAKRIVDDLAKFAGVDDATDEIVRYSVRQECGQCCVRIRISPRIDPAG